MKYSRNPDLEEELLDQMMDQIRDDTRTQPSVTGMIRCLTRTYLDAEQPLPLNRQTKLYFSTGLAIERAILVTQRGEDIKGTLNGVAYHFDSLSQDILREMKSTRIRASTKYGEYTPEKFSEHWLRQFRSYCKAANTTRIQICILHLIEPELACWDVEFTQEEIDENWEWILSRAETYNAFIRLNKVPTPFRYNAGSSPDSYECKSCQNKIVCEAISAVGETHAS